MPGGAAYVLLASRQGYFDGAHRGRPGTILGGARIELKDGEWFSRADIALWKPAAITGTVRDENGEPLVGAAVQALLEVRIGGQVRRAATPVALTDDRGMYRLANLKPGRYVILVPSIQVTLPDGTAVVGGSSRQATSAPPLNLMRSTDSGTNDGMSLLVGSFPTAPEGKHATAYPMMFHPTARKIDDAAPVMVGLGELRTTVDVQLVLVPSFRVSGRVTGMAEVVGNLPVWLSPAGIEEATTGAESAFTMTDSQGNFTFHRVPAGDYKLTATNRQGGYSTSNAASSVNQRLLPERINPFNSSQSGGTVEGTDGLGYRATGGSGPGAFGRMQLAVVDQNVEDVLVPLVAGVTISGHFVWDGSATPPAGTRFLPSVRAESSDGNLALGLPFGGISPPADPAAVSWPFTISSVLPGRYVFASSSISTDFVLEAIELGGRDLLTSPLEVTGDSDIAGVVVRLTSKKSSVTGFVRTSAASTAINGAVIFFPVDRAHWKDYGLSASRFATTAVTASGSYRAPFLPPGDYYAAAVPDADRPRFLDPEFLATLVAHASRIRVSPGSQINQDLQMVGGAK